MVNNRVKKGYFRLTPVASAVMLSFVVQGVQAGPGTGVNANGVPSPTFYANSPSGLRYDVNDAATRALLQANDVAGLLAKGKTIDTGTALRKFVDPLPTFCPTKIPQVVKNTAGKVDNKCLPLAIADKVTYPGSDYYEIGVVEYEEYLHSDLAKPTKLRGYVQLNDPNNPTTKTVDPVTGYVTYTQWPQAHYLGPVMVTKRGTPVRVKFVNLLPEGKAHTFVDSTGKPHVITRNGDLFLPVDQTLMGAGLGPDGATMYLQNRAELHLHGGDTPWISDGTPHQWVVPGTDETDLKRAGMADFARGAVTQNVPDMPDPGPGAVTYYWPNNQSARLMFYHDHAAGITRLNVYGGEAAGYLLTDDAEAELVANGALPAEQIPLVIQEKGFVPKDVQLQDAKWDKDAWGREGDLWFPHVYEVNQDPTSVDGTNPTGRWDWGPWFWPVFPSLYALPSGDYGDVSTTPEAFMDTPLVNGQAYPFMNLEPRAYRFRILNATNDRFLNLSLFVADDSSATCRDPNGPKDLSNCFVEPKMVQFMPGAAAFPTTGGIMGTGWGQPDARNGGVPDPATAGPNILQIGTEAGLIPAMVEIPPTPVNFEYGRRSITVLNILEHGLLMGSAERADVVIDFSKYAGKTLILYNDTPAPVPAFDPRVDYFHNSLAPQDFGNYLAGGAQPTKPGYGPNTRTIMQIRVAPAVSAAPTYKQAADGSFDKAFLASELPKAYGKSQEPPIIPQAAYNKAFNANWTDQYARINVGTLQSPTFDFTPANGSAALGGIKLTSNGAGYARPPIVKITDANNPQAAGAMASATLKISQVVIANPGSGYVNAPIVTIGTGQLPNGTSAPGTGASGAAYLKVVGVKGFTAFDKLSTNVSFEVDAPPGWARWGDNPAMGIVRAKLAPVFDNPAAPTKVVGVQVVDQGAGYTVLPRVTVKDWNSSDITGVTVTLDAGVERVTLISPVPSQPELAGGRGYTNMSQVTVNFTGGGVTGNPVNRATARAAGSVSEVTLASAGNGYNAPVVTLVKDPLDLGVTGVAYVAAAVEVTAGAKMAIHNKAIQELFEPNYGRMNATLGIEMPFTSALTQTTIPLAYIDPTSEELKDGETQIWKITHNGVDSHPVHFHLANLQLVNRIGWDGTVKPPKPNELGWKETIMMNPLEDIVVAVRAKRPSTKGVTGANGFGLPESYRLMDPTQPQYALTGFTQIDAKTGSPTVVYNDYQNYNWEYVWHCHILGHEENDFMRPLVFDPMDPTPIAPTIYADAGRTTDATNGFVQASSISNLYWKDNAETEYKYAIYLQSRTQNADGTWPDWTATRTLLGNALANANQFQIPANLLPAATIATGNQWRFIVSAIGAKAAGEATVTVGPAP